MDFFLVALTFWSLVILSLLLLIHGLWKKSWQSLVVSGFAFLLPMLYFAMVDKLFIAFALLPIVPFILAYNMKKKEL
ncbi:hypothetical protein [Lysinibacillus endophyticus]|uniref:Uncharacterized protein n=1 Tax=Ureibacillus endophyticus TaxID=1978490 RepID=A0A494YUE9_9BACL|nr:hypothetical protein [Lysinibacillus endophyticus]MCP1145257.1 hypothetical protein [Lysinibacillus endophyticus]RKQ13774.1 hypothetical protein D8M03_15380 [Lysinibacillus endophyticus]